MEEKGRTKLKRRASSLAKGSRQKEGRDDEQKSGSQKKENLMPWEAPEVNERVIKSFNLRLSEPDFLKLKFVASRSIDKSVHAFCLRVLMDEVKKKLSENLENTS